ncbi:MAG TPA: hypothetical protein VGB13_05935 [Candidatus Krumholzibacteria bacterium]|jgi:hypothetical protein
MWTRRIVLSLLLLLGAAAAKRAQAVDLGGWESRDDRMLIIFLLDGFDERRVDAWNRDGEALLPALRELRSSAVVFDDVQSGAIGAASGLHDLFGDDLPEIVDGSPAELSARLRRALLEVGPQLLVLGTDLFRDATDLDDALLARCDPSPWANHLQGDSRATHEDRRRRRAEMLQRLYAEGRPIRRDTNAQDMDWIGDAMHLRAERSLRPLWDSLAEESARERSLIVITARVGPADPRRGAPAPPDALRPDLVDVPFWLLTPTRDAAHVQTPLQSGALVRSLRSLDATATHWQAPEPSLSRWSFHTPLELRPPFAAIWWRHPEFSLLLRNDGAHELYDRRNDPGEWENLAAQQSSALSFLQARAARELLGERLTVLVRNPGGAELLIQPAASVENLQGDGWLREGPLLRLNGEGPWEFEVDPAGELRMRSSASTTTWQLGGSFRMESGQIKIALTRPELQHGLDWNGNPTAAPQGVQVLLRAGEAGLLRRP